jgi:septum formation protein
MKRFVLASASNRRRALLTALGLPIEVIPSGAPECDDAPPPDVTVLNARAKRDEVARRLDGGPPAVVIAADTLVFLDGETLSKPAGFDEARAMLSRLSGNTHEVITGLALCDTATGEQAEDYEVTEVTFRRLSPSEIDAFVETVKPTDRAGGYTSDGPGSLLIAGYRGCYYNVLGLPVVRLDQLLRGLGISLFDEMDRDRALFL